MTHRARWTACFLLLFAAASCDSPFEALVGELQISISTTGGDLDLDGYEVVVGTEFRQAVAVNGAVLIPRIPAGSHAVQLDGVAANCAPAGGSRHVVTVTGGERAQLALTVSCVATGVHVTTATTGIDLDLDGYAVAVDGGPATPIGGNHTLDITRLSAGPHTVALSGLAANCAAGDNPRAVTIAAGAIAPVAFAISCRSVTGTVLATVATTGVELDPNGYAVQLDGSVNRALAINATTAFDGLPSGDHIVALSGVAANCTITGENPRTVSVITGGITRDTARTTFQVTCVSTSAAIALTTATTGVDLDPNGYTVQLDGGPLGPIAANQTVVIEGLSAGSYSVTLGGEAGNCTIAGDNPRSVSVTTGGVTRDTARTTFQVTCVSTSGAIALTTTTTGVDLDPNGYTFQLDGGPLGPLAPNDTVVLEGVGAGAHSLRVAGAAGNCTIAGDNPRTINVTTGGVTRDTARTTFQVTCAALTGVVQITAVTTGTDLDPNGYRLLLDDGQQAALATNGTASFQGASGGDHSVMLEAVAGNCAVVGPNPRSVSVTVGGTTRDTARATFQVTCAYVEKIAFQRGLDQPAIGVVYADGSNAVTLVQGAGPTWAPDRARMAFAGLECYYDYYYYDYCYYVGLSVLNADGTGFARLTFDGSDGQPAWRPDGSKIVFATFRGGRSGLYVVNPDGSGLAPIPLPQSVSAVLKPAWSPDGAKVAFTCVIAAGNFDICVVNADGTGFLRLTSDPAEDAGPAWKPDGSQIAFSTRRYGTKAELALMNPDGSNVVRVNPLIAAWDPSWSPDGTRIVFAELVCDPNCRSLGLWMMSADATELTRLTSEGDYAPAWRR
ncbi:MAG: TolB family protein [Gemmatimonadales bacterium]